jgi:hypothetical protein
MCASFGCKPIAATILPGQIQKFTITATGMKDGPEQCSLVFSTPNLVNPMVFRFEAAVNIATKEDFKNIQTFAKVCNFKPLLR